MSYPLRGSSQTIALLWILLVCLTSGLIPLASAEAQFVQLEYRGGFHWKSFRSIAVMGDHAYSLTQLGLVSFDLSDLTAPQPIAHMFLPYDWVLYSPVFASDSRVFIAAGDSWFTIDVSDPAHPFMVSSAQGTSAVRGIHAYNEYVYVSTQGEDVLIYDAGIPETPVLVGSLPGTGVGSYVEVSSGRLYAASTQLNLLDLASPDSPTLLGSVNSLSWSQSLTVQDNYAYVGDLFNNAVITVDLTLETAPQVVHVLDLASGVVDLEVRGAHGLALLGDARLVDLDFANPAAPESSGVIQIPSAGGIALHDTIGLVTDYYGVYTYNLKTSFSPAPVGEYRSEWNPSYMVAGNGYVYLLDDEAYLEGNTDSILVIDVHVPEEPVIIQKIVGVLTLLHLRDTLLLAANPITVGTTHPRTQVYDVSDPASPQLLSHFDASGRPDAYASQDSLVFVGTYAGIDIWNLADPLNPQKLSAFADLLDNGMTPHGDWLYTFRQDTLAVWDISDPVNPAESHTLPLGGNSKALLRVDTVLIRVTSDEPYAMVLYDVADPLSITQLGSVTLGNASSMPVATGNRILIGTTDLGVQVVDISDPTAPQVATNFPARGMHTLALTPPYVAMSRKDGFIVAEMFTATSIALGDVNADFAISSADIVYAVNYVFKGGSAPLPDPLNGDVTCDGAVTSADIIYLINYVFKGGPAPGCS